MARLHFHHRTPGYQGKEFVEFHLLCIDDSYFRLFCLLISTATSKVRLLQHRFLDLALILRKVTSLRKRQIACWERVFSTLMVSF